MGCPWALPWLSLQPVVGISLVDFRKAHPGHGNEAMLSPSQLGVEVCDLELEELSNPV